MTAALNTIKVTVRKRRVEADGIISLELAGADDGALPRFKAGAHIDVHLPGGLVRQYSLCNDDSETQRYVIAVLLEPQSRGGSLAVHALKEGDQLQIGQPRNLFELAPRAEHTVLFAGGIGITPMLSMARHLHATKASFELVYCSRSVARTAFRDWLQGCDFADRVRFHHGDEPQSPAADFNAILARQERGAHLYVCGPSGFMEAVLAAARAGGWDESALHREYFSAPLESSTLGGSQAFRIVLARTCKTVQVEANQTALEALVAAGVAVPSSCEQGICGTCLTDVLDGKPDHRDAFLTDAEKQEGKKFILCCSRSLSDELVLDL